MQGLSSHLHGSPCRLGRLQKGGAVSEPELAEDIFSGPGRGLRTEERVARRGGRDLMISWPLKRRGRTSSQN